MLENPYGTLPRIKPLKDYFGIVVEKKKTPFVHISNVELLKSVSKNIPSNIGLLTMIEYPNEVFYCSSSLLKDIAVKDNMPNRIVLIASLLNMNSAGIFCLVSVLDMITTGELSTIVDISTGKEADIPEDVRRQNS